MNVTRIITAFLTIAVLGLTLTAAADGPATKATVVRGLTSMPLAFTENQGQWDEQVLFRANAGGATMWFTKDGAYYQFTRRIDRGRQTSSSAPSSIDAAHEDVRRAQIPAKAGIQSRGRQMSTSAPSSIDAAHEDVRRAQDDSGNPPQGVGHPDLVGRNPRGFDNSVDSLETMMIKADLVGSNPTPRVVGEGLLEYKCNYFLGNDPAKWRTDVPNYSAIVYEDIYPGIYLKYYGNGKQMEYDFIVSPGADPSQIMVQYEGAKSINVNEFGELVVETDWGEVIEQRPVVYQMPGSDRVSLAGEYVLKGNKAFGFELPDSYDAGLPLVIDPTLVYSTYLGGSSLEEGYHIAVDASGAAYVTGITWSTDFPTENPYQTDQGDHDVFVTKLSSSGSSLVYSTYLGGSSQDWGFDIAVDASGAAYVTGITWSTDFPTENPYQTDQGDYDVFVTKLSSSGSSLVYSTYLGGSGTDWGNCIAVDTSGAAYVSGGTESTDFPTENPYQTDQGGWDVFVTKLSSSGSSLVYSTYLGGNDDDRGYDIAVDASGAAYVTGYLESTDFPTENPYQTDQDTTDVFVTKLSSSGSSLVYSTYLGGRSYESPWGGIAVDASGAACVTGYTQSTDFPTENPNQGTYQGGISDVFVTKLSSLGSSLVYSTYLGGSDADWGNGIAVDTSGAAYVSGGTQSTDFPTLNPYQTYQDGSDAFVTKLVDSCCNSDGIRGDCNYDMSLNMADLTYLVDYLFRSGPPPPCPEEGDINGDGDINVADLTYLVDYLFRGGPPPPPCP